MRRAILPKRILDVRRHGDKHSGLKTGNLLTSPIAKVT
jgi:hypothetical protein